ncbi:YgjP-like metallopeptidase domain-containing protein [Lentzea sp. NPDC034063]|uniref:YgjP-like metallopeptidase domain-containing protein n=1 Tax=unclassified Lentzea TaxID=2643253 RepID=UPI0033F14A9E
MTSSEPFRAALAAVSLPADWQIEVVVRPRRRRLALEVEPGGAVLVLVPQNTDPRLITWFVTCKRQWLTEKVKIATRLAPAHPIKEFIDGEEFHLYGASYRLQLVDHVPAAVDQLPAFAPEGILYVHRQSPAQIRLAIIGLYRKIGLAWLQRHGRQYELDGQISDLTYVVRDLGRRHWGLYYTPPKHTVAAHWSAFSLPVRLVEYLLAHEMAHATGPAGRSHGPAWQRQMNQWMPDWRQRQSELAETGRHAWLGGWNRPA